MLVAVNALRPAFRPAPTARSARPSDIDRACAQRRSSGTYVMAGYVYCGANGTYYFATYRSWVFALARPARAASRGRAVLTICL